METLDLPRLKTALRDFAHILNVTSIPELFGVTDGKAVGTYLEHSFNQYLRERFSYTVGSSASGIDFPEMNVDLKVTSIRQPQSSCPFRDASQKVYGLGYHLLLLVYDKIDDTESRSARLTVKHLAFISRECTGDYQTTYGLREILRRNGNKDDVMGFLEDRNLPLDEVGRELLAERIMNEPPNQGYLTVSNALQWRLQYSRVVSIVNSIDVVSGLENLLA